MTSPRVLGVTRLSAWAGEDDPSTSLERQDQHILNGADARGMTVVDWARDPDVSATRVRPWLRPELGRWLPDLDDPSHPGGRPEEFDVLMFWRLDRIVRSMSDLMKLIDWALKNDKNIVSVTEPIDLSTPIGRAMVQLIGVFAELEAATIRERVIDGNRALLRMGRFPGGKVPHWLQSVDNPDGPGKVLALHPKRAPDLREAIDMILDAESVRGAWRHLRDQGWEIGRATLPRLLRSPLLAGEYATPVIDASGGRVRQAVPLLTDDEFQRLQIRLDEQALPKDRERSVVRYPLSGLGSCGVCGGKLHHRTMKNRWRYLGCTSHWDDELLEKCPARPYRAEDIEGFVEKMFLDLAGGVEVATARHLPAENHSAELEKHQATLDYLLGEIVNHGPSVAAKLQGQITAVSSKVEELSQLENKPARVEWEPTGRTYREEWDDGDSKARRVLLRRGGFRFAAVPLKDDNLDLARRLLMAQLTDGEEAKVGWQTQATRPFGVAVLYQTNFQDRLRQDSQKSSRGS